MLKLFLILVPSAIQLFTTTWSKKLHSRPSILTVAKDTNIVAIGTEKGHVVFLGYDGKTKDSTRLDSQIKEIIISKQRVTILTANSLYIGQRGLKSLKRVILDLAPRCCVEVRNFIFVVANDRLLIYSRRGRKIKTLKLPATGRKILAKKDTIFISGSNFIMALHNGEKILWKQVVFNHEEDYGLWKFYKATLNLKVLLPLDSIIITDYYNDSLKQSFLYAFTSKNGKLLWVDTLQRKIFDILYYKNALFVSTGDYGIRRKADGFIYKINKNGKIIDSIHTYIPFLILYDSNTRIGAIPVISEFDLFDENLNNTYVTPFGNIGGLPPMPVDLNNDGFQDLIVHVAPTLDTIYMFNALLSIFPKHLKKVKEMVKQAENEKPEKALSLLSIAREYYLLFGSNNLQEVEKKIANIYKGFHRKRTLFKILKILGLSLLFFVVFNFLIVGLRAAYYTLPFPPDQAALRELESGFYHSMKKRLLLLKGLQSSVTSGEGDHFSTDLTFNMVVEEMIKLVNEYRDVFKKARIKSVNRRRILSNLKKLRKSKNEVYLKRLESDLISLKEEFKKFQVSLRHMVEELVEEFKKTNETPVKFIYEIKDFTDVLLYKDVAKIYKLFIKNAVQNAIEACECKGRGEVKISLQTRFGENGFERVIVIEDNGIGMSEEILKNFWRKGFTTGKKTGQGLGITEDMVYFIKMRGDLVVQSEPMKGTRIEVIIR